MRRSAGARRAAASVIGAAALCAAGCRALAQPEVIATYEGGTITRDDYLAWLAVANLEDDASQRTARLGQIAMARTLGAALVARGGDRAPGVAGQLADLEDRVLSQALQKKVIRDVKVTDAEVDQALKENDADRHHPPRVQLANLFKRVPAGSTPARRQAVRARIEELRGRILAGADFAELARTESDSETRRRGGRMGVASPGQLPPLLEKVAFQLAEGQVSQVIEHPNGFTILKCLHVFPARTMPVEEARQKLRQHLQSRAEERRWDDVRKEALGRWPLVVALAPDAIRSAEPSTVVARFGERSVTAEDLDRWLGRSAPRAEASDQSLRAMLEERARMHAAARRAAELRLGDSPEVAGQLSWGRLRVLATEEMMRRVQEAFKPPTEEELRARFEATRERHVQPRRFRVSVLRFGWEGEPKATRVRRAEDVMERVRAGQSSFEQAAREYSTHPSASRGGDLGWLTALTLGGLGPSVAGTLQLMEKGEVGPVVQDGDALWGLRLADREEERPQTFEEARMAVRREMGTEQTQALQKRIEERLLAELHLRG